MEVKKDMNFNQLKNNCWSGAIYTLNLVENLNKEEELMYLLEEIFTDKVPTMTEVNDFLWFDTEYIYQVLSIYE